MNLIATPSETVEAAHLLARLAKAEQVARESLESSQSHAEQHRRQGEIAGLRQAARMTRELANWPVEQDSGRV
jgi:hypothetical protein